MSIRPHRTRLLRASAAVGLSLLALGCGSSHRLEGLGSEGDFLRGREFYEEGRCFQAAEALQSFLSEHPGSARVDDAIYYLGLSRKCLGEYILAREEFDRLLREFPQSGNREDAEWQRALCFHESRHSADRDPEPTEQAIKALRSYLSHYPDGAHREEAERLIRDSNDRLARKEFENGKTYLMLRKWKAAAVYFEKSLEILPESSVAPRAYLGMVRSQAERGEVEATEDWVKRLETFATPERRERYGDALQDAVSESQAWVARAAETRDRLERERERRLREPGSPQAEEAEEQATGGEP